MGRALRACYAQYKRGAMMLSVRPSTLPSSAKSSVRLRLTGFAVEEVWLAETNMARGGGASSSERPIYTAFNALRFGLAQRRMPHQEARNA
jgi:hypothetical protein